MVHAPEATAADSSLNLDMAELCRAGPMGRAYFGCRVLAKALLQPLRWILSGITCCCSAGPRRRRRRGGGSTENADSAQPLDPNSESESELEEEACEADRVA